jgi:pyruvate/2-oxoglutarate dehydrogenase complex dihydrolipoamide dehydrogenase (E3) component
LRRVRGSAPIVKSAGYLAVLLTIANLRLIAVDEHLRTEISHIDAAGDVIGFPALASPCMAPGHRAARHAFDYRVRSDVPRLLPTGNYTIPEVGIIGETEATLEHQGVDYVVVRCGLSERREAAAETRVLQVYARSAAV